LKNTTIKILFLFFLYSVPIFSQTEQDSTNIVQSTDTAYVYHMTKSPWGAVGRSAILPGLGQIYNESYWKAPVIWGFLGYFISVWINQNNLYKENRDLYEDSISDTNPYGNEEYLRLREFYRDQRNDFAIYIVLTYLLNLVDAYVDAHMFDFDVSPEPMTNDPKFQLNFKLNF